jgi:hypothetical protein
MICNQVDQSLLTFTPLNDVNDQECYFSSTSQKILSFSEDNNESINGLNNNKLSDIFGNNCDIKEDEIPIDIFNNIFQEKFVSILSSNNFENDKSFNIIEEKGSIYEKTKEAKRRGRKRRRENRKIHNKYDFDNLLTKIQVHFLKFVINLSNDALKTEFNKGTSYNFKQISYKEKRNVNYDYFMLLKKSKIKDILQINISEKYKNFGEDENKKTFNDVNDVNKHQWLNKFFNIDYIKLFSDYYLKPLKRIDFEGKIINFSEKTKSFNDLLAKNPTIRTQLIDTLNCAYLNG